MTTSAGQSHETATSPQDIPDGGEGTPQPSANCFPALGFKMPGEVPEDESSWWCDPASEYAFLGFGYEVTACERIARSWRDIIDVGLIICKLPGQSPQQLKAEFTNIRNKYKGRYIRLYGVCDKQGY